MTRFENFYQSDQPVRNRFIRFEGFQLKFIIGASSNLEHLSLFWSYLPHLNLESHAVFLLDSLFFNKYSIKISYFFSLGSTGWEPIQPNHWDSLYGALILEPKSYLVMAHKLQISPSHSLGHLMGCLQPTISPFWILGG